MFIPDIPVIHRLRHRFRVCRDSRFGANVLLSQGAAFPETERHSQRRSRGERRKSSDRSRSKRGPGNRKEEARGGGSGQCRTHFPSRVRRNWKPPGRRFRERTTDEVRFNGRPIGTEYRCPRAEISDPAREPWPAFGPGAGPAGTGPGSAMILRRNLRDRPGPQGLGRNLPGKGGLAFGQDRRT